MTVAGPHPAIRTADETAQLTWDLLLEAIQRHAVNRKKWPNLTDASNTTTIERFIYTLYALTGEDNDSIRQRAQWAALANTDDPALFT